ncbi:GNAT superfamily N-acetyltransferase [Catenuloplanes nepalensis]|uniref:GNAT superfamily N-acetyltransferase n=1 Tax=Catenuloplanes nepalensis TaxID=587533 RepID=A0ABT9N0C2_9ACTN|nr:GNAT family N-acetyltransferase [Catenuloplanes nepalensis]MDP9797104.1 GNAT superfamily N-acetyltransferase [Catenuloplanes nepalensis]
MVVERHDLDGPDGLDALLEFTRRTWTAVSRWHVGDIAWTFGQFNGPAPGTRTSMWREHGRTLAAITAYGAERQDGAVLTFHADQARPDAADTALTWAKTAYPHMAVGILETEHHLGAALARAGLRTDPGDDGPFFLAHRVTLDGTLPPPKPAGYLVRPVHGRDEIPRRAALHRAIWAPSSVTDERYRTMAARPPYRPEFDTVVEDPGGELVAYCLGWYDEANRAGLLEPIGTLARHRRRGLARAAILATLHAFREAGGDTAIVHARGDDGYPIPRAVYPTAGFTPFARTRVYR